ncbi:MAG: glycosyltransferase family 2 protein [Candidatus Omnitrophica bacterium]|nr:glycosyltransferase family 2 protein [Candidatus Omnitrophota bacterium]
METGGSLIELSVVLPCLNEEEAIGVCVKRVKEVFAKEGIRGEIIVADNGSTDRSIEIAKNEGAKVVIEHKRGYGSAYLRGFREVSGKYVVMADSDLTYDFYDIPKFLKALREGNDFVMGSRFKGKIQKKAMPWMNRYIGNPILSGMTRVFFRTKLSDIHCGMRGFSLEAYQKMKLRTIGMEFATEMVVAALQNDLKTCEIPIHYHPRKGESKLNPFFDAWRHMRFMLLYCPLWLYFIPGLVGFILGFGVMLLLLKGPFLFFGHRWDVHLMTFASAISILSYQVLGLGVFAHSFAIRQGFLKYDQTTLFFQRHFSLERGLGLGGLLVLMSLIIITFIFIDWFSSGFGALYRIREAILATTLLVIGIQTIFSSFFVSLLFLEKK